MYEGVRELVKNRRRLAGSVSGNRDQNRDICSR